MIASLILAGVLAHGTAVLHANFDLSRSTPLTALSDKPATRPSRYIVETPDWDGSSDTDGVQVRIHGRKIRVRVPLPSL